MTALSLGTSVDLPMLGSRGPRIRPPGPPGPSGAPPTPVSAPRLTGAGRVGSALSIDPGGWAGVPTPVLGLQWQARVGEQEAADLPGATGATLMLAPGHDLLRLRCRVTARNPSGTAVADSELIAVAYDAPSAAGGLADAVYVHNSGVQVLNAFSEFTGGALTFGVTGEGVTIDPATGMLRILTDALRDGVEVIVTASNSGGVATSVFRLTIAAEPVPAPAVVTAPALLGAGKIGAALGVDTGVWSVPLTSLTLQWRRDGADIAGAVEASYTPVAADDLSDLVCAVTATNAAGSFEAVTEPLRVTYVAPQAAGGLADLLLDLGGAAATVAAAGDFTGDALRFAVAGAGAEVDAATGVVGVPADTARAQETVTVTATNSGGAASSAFRVSVVAVVVPVAPPQVVGEIGAVRYPQDSGIRTVSTQAAFAGEDLSYALDTAPQGVTIHAGSGLVSIATAAELAAASVTVRASNAGGSAALSFTVTVRATTSVFDTAERLGDLGFVFDAAAPAWAFEAGGWARLVPAATGRVHGAWARAAGDGLYRCLARWNSASSTVVGNVPFVFGARIARSGDDFTGVFVETYRTSGIKLLRLQQYTGAGAAATLVASAAPGWVWNSWYWIEMELDGASVKARLYPEAAAAPDWQLQARVNAGDLAGGAEAAGAFGPGGLPLNGVSPTILIRRLEFHPLAGREEAAPAAASAADWSLEQVAVQP